MSHSGALVTSRNMDHKQRLRSDYTSKLEGESQRMEDRLKMLRTMMAAEKSRRDAEGGIHWKSGQTTQPSKKSSAGSTGRPIRVRVLTDKESKSRTKPSGSNYTPCGQCDKTNASLSCIECAENYCQVCFIKFHQKGALAKHRVRPHLSKSAKQGNKTCADTESSMQQHTTNSPSSIPKSHPPSSKQANSTLVGSQDDINSSLLDGTYDETASAALFQQALAEWRNGESGRVTSGKKETCSKGENTQQTKDLATSTMSSAGTNTSSASTLTKERKQIEVTFSGETGVSYFEKIITKRNRYDPTLLKKIGTRPPSLTEPIPNSNMTGNLSTNEQGEIELTPTQYNIFYDPEDIQYDLSPSVDDDCEAYSMYRHLSSVQIEEIEITKPLDSGEQSNLGNVTQVTTTQDTKVTKSKKKHVFHGDKRKVYSSQEPKQNRVTSGKKTKASEKTVSRESKSCYHPRTGKHNRLSSKSETENVQTPKSGMSDVDMEASVKKAWSECGHGIQRCTESRPNTAAAELSQFFLHGVEHIQTIETDKEDTERGTTPQVKPGLQFAANIWLPDNSIIPKPFVPSSLTPIMNSVSGDCYHEDSDSNLEFDRHEMGHEFSSTASLGTTTRSKSKLSFKHELLVGADEFSTEKSEWDQEDNEALENLAWELASTVESEGRLSRCDSELDNIDDSYDYQSVVEVPATGYVEECCEVEIGNVDMERVVSEFELYQKQLINEEM